MTDNWSSVTFETATIADACARAARVAPNKGAAFDKAQGIVLEFDQQGAVVKSSDLETHLIQVVSPVEVKQGDTWRFPNVLANVLANLPLGQGQTITMWVGESGWIEMKSARWKGRLRQIESKSFPSLVPYDTSSMVTVPDLGARLAQVAHATEKDKTGHITSGVHIDGEYLTATDLVRVARVPLTVPVTTPITASLALLSGILADVEEVQIEAVKERLHVMPNSDTYASCLIFADTYPDVNRIWRDDHTGSITVDRQEFEQAITRMVVLAEGERYPRLEVVFSDEVIALRLNENQGELEEELDCQGGSSEGFKIAFTPRYLVEALRASRAEQITLSYGPTHKHSVYIKDDAGYESVLMPRV